MKRFLSLIIIASLLMIGISCKNFTESVDPIIDQVADEELNRETR
jgi:hypothetical protein